MKKNVLMAALIAVLAFGLFSCNKDEASKKDLLTREGGWQLAEGTITPAYQMASGDMIYDLMDYLYACEKARDDAHDSASQKPRVRTAAQDHERRLRSFDGDQPRKGDRPRDRARSQISDGDQARVVREGPPRTS